LKSLYFIVEALVHDVLTDDVIELVIMPLNHQLASDCYVVYAVVVTDNYKGIKICSSSRTSLRILLSSERIIVSI
jgi:hypothetical protein